MVRFFVRRLVMDHAEPHGTASTFPTRGPDAPTTIRSLRSSQEICAAWIYIIEERFHVEQHLEIPYLRKSRKGSVKLLYDDIGCPEGKRTERLRKLGACALSLAGVVPRLTAAYNCQKTTTRSWSCWPNWLYTGGVNLAD